MSDEAPATDILPGLCHKLGSPLGALVNHLHLLEMDRPALPAAAGDAVSGARQATASLRRLLDGTRRFLAFREHEPAPGRVEDLGALLREAAETLPLIAGPGARAPEVDAAPDIALAVDPEALEMISAELLLNAARAGAERVEVEHETPADGGHVLRFRDDGRGLAADTSERWFDPFFTTWPDEGVGLGLVAAADLAKRLGGELSLAPGPQGGAEAILRLPPA